MLFKPKHHVKETVEQPKKTVKPGATPSRSNAAGRRPKRAAAAYKKSYREPDTDDSQSESEEPLVPKAKDLYISYFTFACQFSKNTAEQITVIFLSMYTQAY